MARAIPNHGLISSEQVKGTSVHNPAGEMIGAIDHLLIEKRSGRAVYVVMSFGGFLGLGAGRYPLPWNALRYDVSRDGYVSAVTPTQLKSAPPCPGAGIDREWERRVHDHYQAPYYWDRGPLP